MSSPGMAEEAITEPVRKVTSVVRADARTGRLVRTVVVTPKVIPAKVIGENGLAAAETVSDAANIDEIVNQTAAAYGLDPALVHSIIRVESNYNPYAVSNKGAQGLMQLIPATARRMGVANSFSVRDNIEAGVKYYKYLKTIFHDDRLALAAYNAGEGAVAKYNFKVPPYPETVNYVYQVGKQWGEATRRRQTAPKPAKTTAVTAQAEVPKAEEHPKLEEYRDSEGRLHLRTIRQ